MKDDSSLLFKFTMIICYDILFCGIAANKSTRFFRNNIRGNSSANFHKTHTGIRIIRGRKGQTNSKMRNTLFCMNKGEFGIRHKSACRQRIICLEIFHAAEAAFFIPTDNELQSIFKGNTGLFNRL